MEARSISSAVLTRRCIVARLGELTLERYRMLVDQNAGALLILLPSELGNLSADLKEEFLAFEQVIMTEEIVFPVYFAIESAEVLDVFNQIKSSSNTDQSVSATEALLKSVAAGVFQMNVNVNAPKKLNRYKTLNIHGVLEGSGNVGNLPTVLVVAHYDSFGSIPGFSTGADANGSGIAALLELMRIFSRMYSTTSTRPDYNVAFLASGAGKLNYFGTKKWLDDVKDSNRFPYINDVEIVICLDSVGKDSPLKVHVSKPPKESSAGARILQNLEEIADEKGSTVQMVHKKIFLSDPMLAWEHEQFAMNKLSGMTLSTTHSHKYVLRSSSLDTKSTISLSSLASNTHIIGEAIARYVFDLTKNETSAGADPEVLVNELAVQQSMIGAWMETLTSEPRSMQFINANSAVFSSLEQAFHRYLRSVEVTSYECDYREPEFVLYSSSIETMHVYSVKPAIFDLVLAAAIGAYLGVFYFISLGFPGFVSVVNGKPKRS